MAELEFLKILVSRLLQNTSYVNIESTGKLKQLYYLCEQLGLNWIGLDWNASFHVDKIVEKKNQINEGIIQVLAHINQYV